MALMRRRPFFFDDLERWFPRDFFSRLLPDGGVAVEWNPRCDIVEKDNEIVVHAELPGVEPSNVELEVRDSTLHLRGEKREERKEEREGGRTYSERFFGSFERAIPIPKTDPDKIEAEMKNGVLEVRIPRAEPEPPPVRKIEVKSRS